MMHAYKCSVILSVDIDECCKCGVSPSAVLLHLESANVSGVEGSLPNYISLALSLRPVTGKTVLTAKSSIS